MALPLLLDIGHCIDDYFAVALAATSPEFRLIGVTTAHDGDGSRSRLVRTLLHAYGRPDVPVAVGEGMLPESNFLSACYDDLQKSGARLKPAAAQTATDMMAEQIARQKGVIIVMTGPLTNVGNLLRQHPDLVSRIRHVYFMGGWTTQALPSYNIRVDSEAAATVVRSGIPITAIGREATRGYRLLQHHRAMLNAATSPGPRLINALHRTWCHQRQITGPGMYDPLILAMLCGQVAVRCDQVDVEITTEDPGKGTMRITDSGGYNIRVVNRIDGPDYISFLLSRIAPQQTPTPASLDPRRLHIDLRGLFRPRHYPGWAVVNTSHPYHTVCIIESGTGRVFLGGQHYTLNTDDILYIPPHTVYSAESTQRMRTLWLYFDALELGAGGTHEPCQSLPLPPLFVPETNHLTVLGRRIVRHWMHASPEKTFLCRATLLELISALFAFTGERDAPKPSEAQRAAFQAKQWIEARVTEDITLEMIADYTSISKYYLVRTFTNQFGIAPLEYQRQLRLQLARRLLSASDTPIREIAYRVGYKSASAFTRAFTRAYGLSPSEERQGAFLNVLAKQS